MSTLQQEYGLKDFEKNMPRKFMEGRERKSQENLQLTALVIQSNSCTIHTLKHTHFNI
jgi:hypothetical protein